MAGMEAEKPAGSRQAIMGLQVAIDLDRRREGRRVAVLIEDWLYCYPSTGDVFLVPRGYETDFASIPKIARWAVNPFGNHAEAAVVHDWLYAVGEPGKRKDADQVFRFAMKEQGVNIVRRNVMYRAVRRGGEKAYGLDKEWLFKDPRTFSEVSPPLKRPSKAAIDKIDCNRLPIEMPRLLTEFGT